MTRFPFLRVTKRVGELQESVTRIEVDDVVSAGIMWGQIGPDVIPIFEEHSARLERGFTMKEWYDMPPMERALVVAVRRVDNASKNLQAEAEMKAARRKAKQKQ